MLEGELLMGDGKASERAYRVLRQMIVSMELEPGDAIDEKSMSTRLGFGRTPVREALQRLADHRLVEVLPRRGTFVAPIRLQDLRAVEEVRWHLESLAARWAAERIEPAELLALGRLIDDAGGGALPRRRDWDVEVDRAFHRLVAAAAKNPFLAAQLARLYDHSVRLLYATRTAMAPVVEELDDYRAIIEGLEASDVEAAVAAVQRHLRASRLQIASGFETALASYPP